MSKKKLAKADPLAINIGGFVFTETGVEVEGRPDFDAYQGALEFATRAQKASGWWLADLMRYGESRPDWKQRLEQIVDASRYDEKTLRNIKYIGENVHPSRRRDDVSFSAHSEVAKLPPEEQEHWLAEAAMRRLSVSDLRLEIRASKRRKVIEGQAALEGKYRILVADPPWRYLDSGVIAGSAYARAESSYDTMSIEDICQLPVEAHLTPNATAFIWVPVPLLFESPGPRDVITAWGLAYKSHRVWDKVTGMPSNYAQQITHEILLICVRGDGKPDVPTPHEPSIFRERVRGEHSEKPNVYLRHWIEKHWTTGPYLELFGREPVAGWTVFGNDARLWAQEAEAR